MAPPSRSLLSYLRLPLYGIAAFLLGPALGLGLAGVLRLSSLWLAVPFDTGYQGGVPVFFCGVFCVIGWGLGVYLMAHATERA